MNNALSNKQAVVGSPPLHSLLSFLEPCGAETHTKALLGSATTGLQACVGEGEGIGGRGVLSPAVADMEASCC